ncbi:hypothetical protein [Haliangium sp.]|uniref:hypothetical protein n=1 Tax=Haliangium sp. TaxID=2663208 RepID=UPI003D0B89F1
MSPSGPSPEPAGRSRVGRDGGASGDPGEVDDAALQARLRDLCLVDVAVLVDDLDPARAAALLEAHADDLADALGAARARMQALMAEIAAGPEPLALVDAHSRLRADERARAAGTRSVQRLRRRAAACRALALFDELAAALLPGLLEVERRRHGHA